MQSRRPLLQLELRDARASAADRVWLTNIYPLYLHDLSEFDETYYHLNDRGLWEPDHLPSWLQDDGDLPLIIVDAGCRLGCALVNRVPSPHLPAGVDFRLAEFFILKRHRRQGIGKRVVFALFDRFVGRWQVSELVRNTPAIRFWRTVIGEYTHGQYEERTDTTTVCQTLDTRK